MKLVIPSFAFAQDFLNSREIAAVRSCCKCLREELEPLARFTLQKELGIFGDIEALKITWHFLAKMNKRIIPCKSYAATRVYKHISAHPETKFDAQIISGLMPIFIRTVTISGAVFSRPTGKNDALVPAQQHFQEFLGFLLQYPEFRLKLNKKKRVINELITMHYHYNNNGPTFHKDVNALRKIRYFPGFKGAFEIFNGKRGGIYTVNGDSNKKIYV